MLRKPCFRYSVALILMTFCGCGSSNEAKYRKASEAVAVEEAHLEGLRADLQHVVKKIDDHRQFVILHNQYIADDHQMETIERKMEKPFSEEYLAVRASAKGDRETIRRLLAPRAQKLDLVGTEYKAAVEAVEAQEKRVSDAVALRNKIAPDPAAGGNDPVAVEAQHMRDAAALYDNLMLPLNEAEIVEALKKRGFDFQEQQERDRKLYVLSEGYAEFRVVEKLGKGRELLISVNTNHTDANLRERTMELSYVLGEVLLKLSNNEAKTVIGTAISESSNFIPPTRSTRTVHGYRGESVTVYAYQRKDGYMLHFIPTFVSK